MLLFQDKLSKSFYFYLKNNNDIFPLIGKHYFPISSVVKNFFTTGSYVIKPHQKATEQDPLPSWVHQEITGVSPVN